MTRHDRPAQFALFDAVAGTAPEYREWSDLKAGAAVLKAFAVKEAPALLAAVDHIARVSLWRHMTTVRGWRMSVAMTNCGEAGSLSDRSGYRYDATYPHTSRLLPALPDAFGDLAGRAEHAAGFEQFVPDACLINRHARGPRLSLHQDRNEGDFNEPIVSVSFGAPATFLWGGRIRSERARRVLLEHGDIVI